MDHPTSTWAQRYGLPDPGGPADTVLAARPDQLRALARSCRSLADSLDIGSGESARAIDVLRAGWSTPDARTAVHALIRAARRAGDGCTDTAGVIEACAAELDRARSAVRDAYVDTDSAITAEGLWQSPAFDITPLLQPKVYDAQRRLVLELYAATDAIRAGADAAIATLTAAIGPDPRPDLPPGLLGPPPTLSGNTSADVDATNRAALAADLMSSSPTRRTFALRVQLELNHAATSSGRTVELLSYDPDQPGGQGGVAIAIGDVTSADSVAVLVPGVANSPVDAPGALDAGAALTAATDGAAPGTSAATVVWLGYDIPLSWTHEQSANPALHALADSSLAVTALDASAGGAELAAFCRHLRGTMDASAGLTLVGHSYGSTVVSQAALRLRADDGVSDIVLLASPGVGYGVQTANGYPAVPADHVYALAFPSDPVPSPLIDVLAGAIGAAGGGLGSGGDGTAFGPDPVSPGYGAQVIEAPSGVPVRHGSPSLALTLLTGPAAGLLSASGADPVHNLDQHGIDNYLGGAAVTAVAAVVAGAYSTVPVRSSGPVRPGR